MSKDNARAIQRGRILAAIRRLGPSTRDRLEAATRIHGNSLRPRVRELMATRSIRVVRGRIGTSRTGRKAQLLEAMK